MSFLSLLLRRAAGVSEQSRYRVTLECTQAVLRYFEEAAEGEDEVQPVGVILPSTLVLTGDHGRLSNLDDSGCLIRDEAFQWNGREALRRAGASARGLLSKFVELRRQNPAAREMMKKVRIMSQPSGFVDPIILSWMNEQLSEEFTVVLAQRDLFAASLSEPDKMSRYLSHIAVSFISGKMTSCLQLTDTDIAAPFKSAAMRVKQRVAAEMKHIRQQRGQMSNFKCGAAEVLRIAFEAHEYIENLNLQNQVVLRGLRRNGMLSWRPSLSRGCLLRSDEQQWAREMVEHSHRIPNGWWAERYQWLSSEGRPLPPDYSQHHGAGVKKLEDMQDVTAHGDEGSTVKLSSWAEMPDLAHGVEGVSLDLEVQEEDLDLADAVRLEKQAEEKETRDFMHGLLSRSLPEPASGGQRCEEE